MRKLVVGDDASQPDDFDPFSMALTRDNIKRYVKEMDVAIDMEDKGSQCVLRVHAGIGTGQFLALGAENLSWLQQKAHKVERRGSVTLYYVKYA
jgi:RNase P protein component